MTITSTICDQIGNKAFAMLGAYDLVGIDQGLQLKIRGSRKCNTIRVTLQPDDTYKICFSKWQKRQLRNVIVAEHTGVLVEQLHSLIERETGLYTSL